MAEPELKSTREVCALLNVSYQELMNLYYSFGDRRIPVEKVGGHLFWSPQASQHGEG
jgi:hypothetical protein